MDLFDPILILIEITFQNECLPMNVVKQITSWRKETGELATGHQLAVFKKKCFIHLLTQQIGSKYIIH